MVVSHTIHPICRLRNNVDSYVTKVKIATGELIVMIWLFLIPAALLLIGIADLDIGYYTFMRIVVFLAERIRKIRQQV